MKIRDLHTVTEWLESAAVTVETVIFKKSPTCPISREAERQFDRWAENLDKEQDLLLVKVDVKADRELSRYLAEALAVRHESPQVIWLDAGRRVKWHASHVSITEAALQAQV